MLSAMSSNAGNNSLFSSQDAVRGMQACLANAAQLSSEAELLRTYGATQRACALFVLALEELGKIVLINAAPKYADNMREFWARFRDHSTKSSLALLALQAVLQPEHGTMWQSSRLNALKLRGLYVDFTDGKFRSPSEWVEARELAAGFSLTLGFALRQFETVVSGLEPDSHHQQLHLTLEAIQHADTTGTPLTDVLRRRLGLRGTLRNEKALAWADDLVRRLRAQEP
jgi:AbiV family abortive infection protein